MNRIPKIALVGRPNVGKSTLFNLLTRTRDSLVSDVAGLTRDRNYGRAIINDKPYLVIDTGGLLRQEESEIDFLVDRQVHQAVIEADLVIFVVDAKDGLTAIDETIAKQLRILQKPIILAVNKTDFADPAILVADFFSLGFDRTLPISAEHRRGIGQLSNLIEESLDNLNQNFSDQDFEEEKGIMLAIIGRPNSGKSTLINRLLGEERLVASPVAGTTRDAVKVLYQTDKGQQFTLIDTAGIRRKSRVSDKIEKFSIVKTLEAVDKANVVLLLIDANEGVNDQDAHLLGEIVKRGRALIIAINKSDNLTAEQREAIKLQYARKLKFVDYAQLFFVSALKGSNVNKLLPAVEKAYNSAMTVLSTNKLTEALQIAYKKHQPPLANGLPIKLQYAHQGGRNPPHIIIHGTRTSNVLASYQNYLSKFFRERFQLFGTPVRISFRDKKNPYS